MKIVGQVRQRILTILYVREHCLGELWEKLNIQKPIVKSSIGQTLTHLRDLGYVEKVSRGLYALTNAGRKLVEE
jgi:Mn-dependent DtxR family transcriptional regulator